MTRIFIVAAALAAATLLGGWSFDKQGPFCIFDRDFTSCGYPSYEACMASARGVGGFCRPNPAYSGDESRRHGGFK